MKLFREIHIRALSAFLILDAVCFYLFNVIYVKIIFTCYKDIIKDLESNPNPSVFKEPHRLSRVSSLFDWLFWREYIVYTCLTLISVAICTFYRKQYKEALFAFLLNVILFSVWLHILKLPAFWPGW